MKNKCAFLFASFLACVVLAASAQPPRLIGWWTMDEVPETTTLSDASGYCRHAELGEGVTIVDGRFGKAARFDGTTNAWARFTSNTALTNLTLSLWFNVPQSYTNNLYPKLFNFDNLYYQFAFTTPDRFSMGLGTGTTRASWETPDQKPFKFTTNAWHHAALVIRRTYTNATDWVAQPIFYLNGIRCSTDVQASKTYFPVNTGSGYGFLGNLSIGGTRALDGALDEVRVYDAALTDQEILALYYNRPTASDVGADQTVFRDTTRLQGRLFSTGSFSRQIAATSVWSVVSAPVGATPLFEHTDLPETAVTLPVPGTYVFRLTACGELGNVSDDMTITRLVEAPSGNAAPNVTAAWATTNTVLGAPAPLAATVTDDNNPGPARLRWTKTSGPGAVFFDNAFTNATAARFSTNGTYVVRLTADDGAVTDSDEITVYVSAPAGNLTDGLSHWWQMDEAPTDKKAYDSTGTITIALENSALLQPGKLGLGLRAPRLDAVGVGSTFPSLTSNMTFSFWFYHDEAYVKRANGNLYQRFYNTGSNFYVLYNPLTRSLSMSTRGIGTGETQHTWDWGSTGITSNRWFHATVLFDGRPAASGSRQVLYLDGVKVLSTPYNTAFPGAAAFTSPFCIANLGLTGGIRNFDGVLDDLRIYSRFLTEEEVRLLATDPDNNHAPVIEAQTSVSVKTGRPAANLAAVFDDGQPSGSKLSTHWSVVSGDPSKVQFDNPNDLATGITFTQSGDYVLRIDASDGERRSAVNVAIIATPPGTLIKVR